MQEINGTLAKFWETESVAENVGRIMNEDDKDMSPERKKERHLTNNYEMALNWLDNTDRRLIKQPRLGEKYCEIIEQYIKKGYLEM